jgi:hypothetical protein
VSTSWGRHFPYYTEGPRGELHTRGNFVHGRPFVTLGYFLWTRTGFAQYLGLDLPPSYSAAHYRLTAKVLKESHRLLAQQLNLRGFVVILSQVYDDTQRRIMEGMREALAREGILYLDYTRLYDGRDLRYRLAKHDYHNSSTANQLIAARLAADLLHHR